MLFPGAPEAAFYVEALSDNRPFFILPFLGQYLIGTTDIRFDGDLDRVKASNDEIDYLIKETNKGFSSSALKPGVGEVYLFGRAAFAL